MKRVIIGLFILTISIGLIVVELQSCKHEPIGIEKLDTVCFQSQVLPIFTSSCAISGCHDNTSHKAGIVTNSYTDIIKHITPGNPSNSKLYSALTGAYNFNLMPPNHPLLESQRTIIAVWIRQGAQNIQCAEQQLPTDGASLYAIKCAGCHNQLATSTKGGATSALIQTGINTIPNMSTLKDLTPVQIQAIADALATITPPVLPADGTSLYALKCAVCHNALETSTKGGATAVQIQNGIKTISNMNGLSNLTSEQIQAIANVLATITPPQLPTDGTSLYALKCANCHNPLATSTKGGASLTQVQKGISTITSMNSLSTLTTIQLQAIVDALATITPPQLPADGVSLYAIKCASCHNPLATSTKGGATVVQIQAGISTVSSMSSLSTLTIAQVQAISTALTTITPPQLPTDGASLYALKCAGCHGKLAQSAKIGANGSRIQSAISSVLDMKSLSTLTATQIDSISKALISVPMPTDGPSLYSINCARCHGILNNSSVGRASVSDIQEAIRDKAKMNYLTFLNLKQIQTISASLAGVKGGK